MVSSATAATDIELQPKWITDVEFKLKATDLFQFAVGANNVFDVYPDRLPSEGAFGVTNAFFPYSSFSPFGFNGRFLYARASANF